MENVSSMTLGIIFIIMLIISALFSCAEIGMMSINRYRLRHLAKKGHKAAGRVNELLTNPEKLLGVILTGNNFALIFATTVATVITTRLVGEKGVFVASIVLTFILLIFAEIIPKTIGAVHSQKVAFATSNPLYYLLKIIYPVVWFINIIANGVLKILGFKSSKNLMAESLNRDELRTVLHDAGAHIPVEYKELLLSVLDLEGSVVDDIMVLRGDIIGIDIEDSWENILTKISNIQHTRILIYKKDISHVLGFVHVRDILHFQSKKLLNANTLSSLIVSPYYIPSQTSLDAQINHFRKEKERIGLVVDEYGDVLGLITVDDIIEEIVGEYTTDMAERGLIRTQNDNSFLVAGTVTIRDLNEKTGFDFPTSGPRTLSGLIVEYLEHIPSVGICMKIAGNVIEVVESDSNMIKKVVIKKTQL